jgi:LysM repeat protein
MIAKKKNCSRVRLTIKHVAAMNAADKFRFAGWAILLLLLLGGCDRMITPRNAQIVKDADSKAAQGEYLRAINLYEAALDDSPRCADIHYKMALIYDDKMNDPLNALHHFKRYLVLSPKGPRADDVRNFMKRDEVTLLTSLSGDSVVTRTEAARLKNENLNLHKVEDGSLKSRSIADKAPIPRAEKAKPDRRSYVVKRGDTLFSISRKFYKSPAHWKEIRDANQGKIDDPGKLKPGERLTIP